MPRSHRFIPSDSRLGLACSSRSWPTDAAAASARGDSGWTVGSFDVTLAVRPDAALDVTELIDADFESPKHGIYREIPIRYAVGMQQYALRFRLLGVDDGAGRSYGTARVLRGEPGSNPYRRRGLDASRSRPLSHPLPRGAGDPLGRDARLG